MRLLDWATRAYALPGVDAACLALQDEHGQCVAFLLWAAWAARTGRRLGAGALERGATLAWDWEAVVTGPLRGVRRALKRPRLDPERQARLRERMQAEELQAEGLLLDALEALAPPASGCAPDMVRALTDAAAAWRPGAPAALITALANAFSQS